VTESCLKCPAHALVVTLAALGATTPAAFDEAHHGDCGTQRCDGPRRPAQKRKCYLLKANRPKGGELSPLRQELKLLKEEGVQHADLFAFNPWDRVFASQSGHGLPPLFRGQYGNSTLLQDV
jgi:hypothetical protein